MCLGEMFVQFKVLPVVDGLRRIMSVAAYKQEE